MRIGLYGAGTLGRHIGRVVEFPFVFVDDTPAKLGTVVDGHQVIDLAGFSRRGPPADSQLYICIYQPGFSFLRKRQQIYEAYPSMDVRPFSELLLSTATKALPYLFFEDTQALALKMSAYLRVCKHLCDDLSKQTLQAHLRFRLTGQFEEIVSSPRSDVPFLKNVLSEDVHYVDVGAYDGDTAEEFAMMTEGRFAQICLVEPDARNIERAGKRLAKLKIDDRVTYRQEALSGRRGSMGFNALGSVASSLDSRGTSSVATILMEDLDVSGQLYIKLDIEGEEISALQSSLAFIAANRPILAISVYHRPDDLLEAVDLIESVDAAYRLYVRCHGEGGEDLMLYAIPEGASSLSE